MNYTEQYIATLKEKQQTIYKALHTKGLFPSQSTPFQPLDETAELILKLTYSLRVGFLEEFTFLFAYVISKASLEQLILDLEVKGYIESQNSKDFGKYFILSKQSLLCLTADRNNGKPVSVPADRFPSSEKLCTYKLLNGYMASRVFGKITNKIVKEFKKQPIDARRTYNRTTYIKQYIYGRHKKGAYSKTDAEQFAKNYLPKLESDQSELERYKAFQKALKKSQDPQVWFAFLKDFFNSLGYSKSTVLGWIYEIFTLNITNFQREQHYTYRDKLLQICPSKSLQMEKRLFLASNIYKSLSITKRSLLNSKTENKTASELATLNKTIETLDSEIATLGEQKDTAGDDFLLMVFDTFEKNDVPVFKEKLITFESLRQSGVFLLSAEQREKQKPLLTFGLMQSSTEELTAEFLFSRIEALLLLAYHHLPSFEVKLRIFIYDSSQMEATKNRLATVRDEFENISSHYATFLDTIDSITITATKKHYKERYEVFKEFCF